jgi:hypothetical protein
LVAQLVCAAFHGPKPFAKAEALHGDGNCLNDRPGNLRWGTHKENMEDMMTNEEGELLQKAAQCRQFAAQLRPYDPWATDKQRADRGAQIRKYEADARTYQAQADEIRRKYQK